MENTAASDGLHIAYSDRGSGLPVVFLHGVGATSACWSEQMESLSSAFRCVALDYRGYGKSDIPEHGAISREAYARDVVAVMDAAGIESAVLCGNSLGGVVALEVYRTIPERVRKLVLVDSFAYFPGGAESIPARLKTLDELGIEQFATTRAPGLFVQGAPELLVARAQADMTSIPLAIYKASTSVTWSGDYRALLPRIDVDTLVIWGEYDTVTPRPLSDELAERIAKSGPLAVVPGAGHLPQMENPAAFDTLLTDFLTQR